MGIRLNADAEFARRSSIPSGGAGTLSDGGFKNCFTGVWLYRDSAGQTYSTTSDGSILHYQAGARECKIGYDNTFGAGDASGPLLQVLFNSGGGTGAVQTFASANFLDEWVYYFFFEDGTNQVAGYIRLSDLNTAVTITRANDNAGSQYINTLTVGNSSGSSTAVGGTYAYARARYEAGITIDDVKTWAASTSPIAGDWGFWPLADNADTGDDSGNARDLTFSSGLDTGDNPPISPPPSVGFDVELRDNGAGTFDVAIGSPNVTLALTGVSSAGQVGNTGVFIPVFKEAMLKIGAKTSATSISSATTTTGITTLSNEPIVVGAVLEQNTAATLTDSYANTWTEITPRLDGDPDSTIFPFYVRRWYCANPNGGSGHTFTVTQTGGNPAVFVQQLIDVDLVSPLVVETGQADTASPFLSGQVTTTGEPNCILVGLFGTNVATLSTFTANNGFTIQTQENNGAAEWTGALCTRIVSEVDAYEASLSVTGTAEGVAWIGAFKQRDVGTDPVAGSHTFIGEENGSGVNPVVTPAIQTQVTGSSFITAHAGFANNSAAPTDTYSNTWTSAGSAVYNGYGGTFDVRMYYAETGVGGNDHTVSFVKSGTPAGEATVPFIEVRNAGDLIDVAANYPTAGNPLTSGSVTTTGPAVLVAFWWGDTTGLTHTAVPNNGFSVIESFGNLPPGSAVQMFVAVKEVDTAGTYDVTWSETPDQGAPLWLFAFQKVVPGVDVTGNSSASQVGSTSVSTSVATTGNSSAGAVGSTTPSHSQAITGEASAGQTGSTGASTSVALTGASTSGQVGSLATSNSLGVTGNSSSGEVGTLTPVIGVSVELTGVSSSGSLGTLSPSSSVSALGNQSSASPGSVAPTHAQTTTGVVGSGEVGSTSASRELPLAGAASVAQVGSTSPSTQLPVSGNQTSGEVGNLVRQMSFDGNSSSVQPGSVGPETSRSLTGQGSTAATGTVSPSITVAITGTQTSTATGSVSSSQDGQVSLTGNQSPTSAGSVASSRTVSISGVSGSGSVGLVSASASAAVTGTSVAGQTGSVTSSTAGSISGASAVAVVGSTSSETLVQASSVSSTAETSSLVAATSIGILGHQSTGQAGSWISASQVAVSGAESLTEVGQLIPSTQVAGSGVASVSELGVAEDSLSRPLDGFSTVGQAGDIQTLSVTVSITGVQASGLVGTITAVPEGSVFENVTGVESSGEPGSFGVSVVVPITGTSLVVEAGDVSASTETNIAVTGVSSSARTGNVVFGPFAALTGVTGVGVIQRFLSQSVVYTVTLDGARLEANPSTVSAPTQVGSVDSARVVIGQTGATIDTSSRPPDIKFTVTQDAGYGETRTSVPEMTVEVSEPGKVLVTATEAA